MPQRQVSGHKLGLRGRVRDAGLPFANSRYREASIRSPNGEVVTGGASLSRCTSGEIGISKEVWLQRAQFVTDPSNHSEMLRRVNITHKSMKLAVTLGRPFGDKSRQMTNSTQQVETTQSGRVEDLHQDLGGNRLKTTSIRGRRGRPPRFLRILSWRSMTITVFGILKLRSD